MPLTDTVAGLPVALCAIDRVPDLFPRATGLNVTVTVWFCPAAIVREVWDTVNVVSFEVIPLTIKGDWPGFVIVKVCWALCPTRTLPNAIVVELMLTDGGCAVALPERATDDELPETL